MTRKISGKGDEMIDRIMRIKIKQSGAENRPQMLVRGILGNRRGLQTAYSFWKWFS